MRRSGYWLAMMLVMAGGLRALAQSTSVVDANAVPAWQTAAGGAMAFEVASVREHIPLPHEHSSIYNGGNSGEFRTVKVPLRMLMEFAYGVPGTRILLGEKMAGEKWVNDERFDVTAKTDSATNDAMGKLTFDECKAMKMVMVQELLKDRFGLAVHKESRQLPVYELVAAKGGAKLTPSKTDGTSVNESRGSIYVAGSDHTVRLLVEALSKSLGRVVVDKTGIDGRYEITLNWTTEDAAAAGDDGPTIFTAIQEQLGLKLEPAKGPVEVLVIDHVEKLSAN